MSEMSQFCEALAAKVGEALAAIGLPEDPSRVVGRPFLFGNNADDGAHIIIGTVISIGYSDKEGIVLYVSSPRYKGVTIRRIRCAKDMGCVESTDEQAAQPIGSFRLL